VYLSRRRRQRIDDSGSHRRAHPLPPRDWGYSRRRHQDQARTESVSWLAICAFLHKLFFNTLIPVYGPFRKCQSLSFITVHVTI